jgi:hypothetical protein
MANEQSPPPVPRTTQLMLRCPTTGRAFPSGSAMDPVSDVSVSMSNNRTVCPHCGEAHLWSKENVFFESESHN